MQLFDDKYAEMHTRIKEDKNLVRRLFEISQTKGLIWPWSKKGIEDSITYFPVGKIGDLYVGIDMNATHNILRFPRILANMRLVYEVSQGEADLSQVYAKLDDLTTDFRKGCGIVSEDMTSGNKY